MRILKTLIFLVLVGNVSLLHAQFGVSARLQNNSNKNWNTLYQTAGDTSATLLGRSYEFGVNYWFRLKNYRLEFLPEISMAQSTSDQLSSRLDILSHSRTSYNFNFNVQLYPLDFYGDCNCPTFSKEGNTLSKGFYWLLSPGISHHSVSTTFDPTSSLSLQDTKMTSFRLGIGAGVDIGLTNLFTVSPFIQYSMNFSNAWPDQYLAYRQDIPENDSNRSNINQWHFGARLIFRPDYKF